MDVTDTLSDTVAVTFVFPDTLAEFARDRDTTGGVLVLSSTAPWLACSVTELTCVPSTRLWVPGRVTVTAELWGGLTRTMPPVKSRRNRPFQVVRALNGDPRFTSKPAHQLSGVVTVSSMPSAPAETAK